MNEKEMPQIAYRRNQGINYMVLEGQQKLLPYEEQMLSANTIPALLVFHIVRADAKLQYWYDITGCKSVRAFVEREGLETATVRRILEAVEAAYRELAQYLITEDKICPEPDTIFLKRSGAGMEAKLCFFPEYGKRTQNPLLPLTEYFISIVDHEKDDVTRLCYALYEEAMQENVTITELLRVAQVQEENEAQAYRQENDSMAEALQEPPLETKATEKKKRKAKEEDFWAPQENPITMDDVFADEEEEEEPTIAERIGRFFTGIPGRLFGGVRKKKEEIFPPKDLEEDLIYDPHVDYSEPTVLLSDDKDSCFGKLVYEGTEDERDYMIDGTVFAIGTSEKGNQAVLRSPVVSHHHARITKKDDVFYLEDLNSTNGTYLNGEAITLGQKYALKYMDRIHFANVAYRIV